MQKVSYDSTNIDPSRWVTVTKPDGTIMRMRAGDIDFPYTTGQAKQQTKPQAPDAAPKKYVATPKAAPAASQPASKAPTSNDWMRWALTGGGGLLAYSLASNMMDNGKKNKSLWEKVLDLIVPLGVGGLGAYGAYRLGSHLGLKDGSEVKTAQAAVGVASVAPDGVVVTDGNGPHEITSPDKWSKDLQTRFEKYLEEYKRDHKDGESFQAWIDRQHSDIASWGKTLGSAALGVGSAAVAHSGAKNLRKDPVNSMAKSEIAAHDALAHDAQLKADYAKPGPERDYWRAEAEYQAARGAAGRKTSSGWRRFGNGVKKWGGRAGALAGAVGTIYNGWDAFTGGSPYDEALETMNEEGKAYVPYWGAPINAPEQKQDWKPAK